MRMNSETLQLLYNDAFNDFVVELTDIAAQAWDNLDKEDQLNVSLFALVDQHYKENTTLLTQKLVEIQKETNATPESIAEGIRHYSVFLTAQSYFLNHIQKLTETL